MTSPTERRLVAILAADVAGYSRLTERNERKTVDRLKAYRRELLEPLLEQHHGRIVKLTGDGVLCEFASVVNAVICAVAIQNAVAEREAETLETERIRFRMGINLGDVILEEDGNIYRDGVNVASRLENAAEQSAVIFGEDLRSPSRQARIRPGCAGRIASQKYRTTRARLSGGVGFGQFGSAVACYSGQTLDRGPALHEYRRRSGAGVFAEVWSRTSSPP